MYLQFAEMVECFMDQTMYMMTTLTFMKRSRVDTGCDTERVISYYVYHILKHEKFLFCIMIL
jgi:hypothetical protein